MASRVQLLPRLRAGTGSKTLASLQTVLSYSNSAVVERFADEYDIAKQEAQRIFQDLLRWLWINAIHLVDQETGTRGVPTALGIRAEQVVIDEMWHIFLLYTDDYRSFCERNFGFFIGHSPNGNTQQAMPEQELADHLLSYLTYVEKHLGTETVFRWFDEYQEKYSLEQLYQRRIYVLQKKLKSIHAELRGPTK